MPVDWNADEFMRDANKDLGINLEKAAIFLKTKIKEEINRTQPRERYVGEEGIYYKGLEPSNPGEPPKKITGFLQRSIAHAMSNDRQQAFVGSNLDYAFYLELGTVHMQPRPFLRSTLDKYQTEVGNIISSGKP